MVGKTVVDAVNQNLELAEAKFKVLLELGVKHGEFVLATSHRQENVDDKTRFSGIIEGLRRVQVLGVPVVYPVHPRARKQMERFGLESNGLRLVEPLDYLAFLRLESCAKLVLTDSGGVQEEACILCVPCVTLRDNTERPETLEVGANILAGTDSERIVNCAKFMVGKKRNWLNPFGDGESGRKIVEILRKKFD
jgi:UDP-N-acetylglucosamine 2-epimerase (non-hydrolysing)